jgi:hypothetical protein
VRGVEAEHERTTREAKEADWVPSARTLAAHQGRGWVLSRLPFLHTLNQTWLIPPAAKLGRLELEPLYLGQRPQDCIAAQSAVRLPIPLLQDENPLLPASSKD